jgi:hypothetical protein
MVIGEERKSILEFSGKLPEIGGIQIRNQRMAQRMLDLAKKQADSDSSDLCETFLGVGQNVNTDTYIERK